MKADELVSEPNSNKPWFKRKRVIIPLALILIWIIGTSGGDKSPSSSSANSSSASTAESATRIYPSSVDGSAVVNPATLAVRFTVRNDGTQPVTPSCDLAAQDSSGTYKGFDRFTLETTLAAGEMRHLVGHLTITKEGASYATDITLECSANTSDTAVSQGNSVEVVDISNCGDSYGAWDPDAGSWYWGACAKASGVKPQTQMTCTERALDENGKTLATNTFIAVALNDLTITGYGENESSFVDSSRAVAKAITSVDYKCQLN